MRGHINPQSDPPKPSISSLFHNQGRMGFMAGRSRVLWCSILFGLFGWALVELMEIIEPQSSQRRLSRGPRGIVSGFICGIFGLCLAKFAEREGKRSSIDSSVSSPLPPAVPEVYCGICMEWNPLPEIFDMVFCSHSFCRSCIRQYVVTKVSENFVSIRCPEPGCKDGVLDPELCQVVVAPEVIDRWERTICEKAIPDKFYCPFKDCSAVLMDERGDRGAEIREAECPHCRRLFCASCEVPWHAWVSCEEFQKLGMDERGQDDMMVMKMAKVEQWQRCPKCKFFVEKTHGCMFIKCRCDFKFCYRCGTEMIKDHYCAKCKG